MKVVGYYVDKDGDKSIASDVFVCIDIRGDGRFEYYAPVGQHGEGVVEYLDNCREITREEYMEASKNLYTPSDYLSRFPLPSQDT